MYVCISSKNYKTGGLLHLSFVDRKAEPLGTEFKNMECRKTYIFTGVELQRGVNDTAALDWEGLNAAADFSTLFQALLSRTDM